MEINILDSKKRVEIWLTSEDSNNKDVDETVKKMIKDYQSKRYFVVIFRSGTGNLLDNSELLLLHNKN